MTILTEVNVTNLRGYYSTSLSVDRQNTVIVGPNNAGKTSILRLLNWVLNADIERDLLKDGRPPSEEERSLLLPARDARHRARRLTLRIKVTDGRSRKKFQCDKAGYTNLRINIRLTPREVVYVALGEPPKGETAESSPEAMELLRRLRDSIEFIHIPSFRDAKSDSFNNTFVGALKSRIEARALHSSQGSPPQEHRDVSNSLSKLKKVLLGLSNPLWDDVKTRLPPGLAQEGHLEFNCSQEDLLDFLESRLNLRVSTGEHDALSVPLIELGSGLQSLLDLAFQESEASPDKQMIIAVEEPEAFLHPSAQRTVAWRLLFGGDGNRKAIVTTHSPVVVEEAQYGDVLICRDQKFYQPSGVGEAEREAINTALLSGYGAEMVFASSVLFVEGEGDRQFFEQIRRRIAHHDPTGRVDTCFVVPVGGKTQFGPWMRLLEAYGTSDDRPIKWLTVCDADASKEVREGFKSAGISVKKEVLDALGKVTAAKNAQDFPAWRAAVEEVNKEAESTNTRFHMMNLEIEDDTLAAASPEFMGQLAVEAGWEETTKKDELLRLLGAKAYGGSEGMKAPWLRGYIGRTIPPNEISVGVEQCLIRWFSQAMKQKEARALLKAWKE